MGYYTNYELSVIGFHDLPKDERCKIDAEIERMNVFEDGDIDSGWWCAYSKWYDCDEDMITLSCKFPNCVFVLSGAGEDRDDLWISYYKNGAMQHSAASIIYEKYDPLKLSPCKNQNVLSNNYRHSYYD